MRTHPAVLLTAVILANLMFVCGCNGERKRLLAANRRCVEQHKEAQADLNKLRGEYGKLGDELKGRDAVILAKAQEIKVLEEANATLEKDLEQINERYKSLLAGGKLPPIGRPPLPEQVDKALRALAETNVELMEYRSEYGMIKLKADFTFDKGSADVKGDAAAALKKFARIIAAPAAAKFNIYVAGHTDDIPLRKTKTIRDHGTNWGLSVHRAVAVIKVLFEAGVEQERMGAMGFSKHHPIAPNAPAQKGNPANRRVEIWIVPPDRFLTVSQQAGEASEK